MAVYVNKLRVRYGSLTLCHLLADSLEELHAMAARLGMGRQWFQTDVIPHYDISVAKREQALAAGARAIDRHQLAELIRRYRTAG